MTVTCQVERLGYSLLDEIKFMVDDHWQEVGSFRDDFERRIDWNGYMVLQARELLICVTAREANRNLIGYIIGGFTPDMHRVYKTPPQDRVLICSVMVYYLVKDKRGYFRNLNGEFERAAEKRGAGMITHREKLNGDTGEPENAAGAFLAKIGYVKTEITHHKLVGRAAHATEAGTRVAERDDPRAV
jgi:hypothetical protein